MPDDLFANAPAQPLADKLLLKEATQEFNVSEEVIRGLIKRGKLKKYWKLLPVHRARHSVATMYWKVQVSRRQLSKAIQSRDEGEGLTFRELLDYLEVSRPVIYGYEIACDPLEGKPLVPT